MSATGITECRDADELAAFFRAAFADDPGAAEPATIRWRYRFDCPDAARRGVNLVWKAGGEIAGHLGVLPVTLDLAGTSLDTVWLLDWYVLPSKRGNVGGMKLMLEATSRYPLVLGVGITPAAEAIYQRTGWHDLGFTARHCALLQPAAVLGARWPALRSIPGAVVALDALFCYRPRPTSPAGWTLVEHELLPPTAVELMERQPADDRIRIRRDRAYLELRYGNPAPWPYFHFTARDGDDCLGWTAWSLKARPDGVRVARLLELATAPERDAMAEALVRHALARLRDAGAHLADLSGLNWAEPALVNRLRLRERTGLKFMWKWRDGEPPAAMKDPARWHLTQGDSDQDR